MRRMVIIYFILILTVLPVLSQVTFGVRGGLAYSSLVQKVGETNESGNRLGYSVAGLTEIPLHKIYKRLSIRSELALAYQGGGYYSGQDFDGMALYNKCRYYSILVPVNLVFTFPFYDIRASLYAGPSFNYSLFGKMTSRDTDISLHFGHTDEKDLRPFDLGVNFGLAIEYNKYIFSIIANCGTLDRRAVKRDGESSVYQNNVTFSIGYYFRK